MSYARTIQSNSIDKVNYTFDAFIHDLKQRAIWFLARCSSDIIHIIIKVTKFYRIPSNYKRLDLEKN